MTGPAIDFIRLVPDDSFRISREEYAISTLLSETDEAEMGKNRGMRK